MKKPFVFFPLASVALTDASTTRARSTEAPTTMTTSADTVRVLVRVRPPNAREIASGYAKALTVHEQRAITLHNRSNARESVKGSSCYAYDHVCDEAVTQEEIFQRVGRDVVDGVVEGYNGCVLAYGQTGAGKT